MASYDVFTPLSVAERMRSYFPRRVTRMLEPSAGTGDLLSAMTDIYDTADAYEINPEYLNALDCPRTTKILGNFLTQSIDVTYDGIVMNPPYLRYQDMSLELRAIVRNSSPVLSQGNVDLYVAFLFRCIELLSDGGTLVAIVPSTWLYNKSCARFRDSLIENRLIHRIHDYGSEKVFPNVSVYCCILVVSKTPKTSYYRNEEVIPYGSKNTPSQHEFITAHASVQNGIATLCDEVFIHAQPLNNEPCWKPIFKVSKNLVKYIIYPYDASGNIVPEEAFRSENPRTYEFMLGNRERLACRDKGHKTYEAWYAFGRRQGITIPSSPTSLYISTLSQATIPVMVRETMLFYSGIRVTPLDGTSCEVFVAAIERNKKLIEATCSKRGNEWINITSSAIKQVRLNE